MDRARPLVAPAPSDQLVQRAEACLLGLALGDAMGMPTQTLTPSEIAARYDRVEDFTAPYYDHPVSHGLTAAKVTDDTEQAFLMAERLIADNGQIDLGKWVADLLAWEADVARRGLRDLLGPSSKAALEAVAAGADPSQTGKTGTTNGAAMRIAPLGLMAPPGDAKRLVDLVEGASFVTHHTGEAIAGAAAVCGAIAAFLDGAGQDKAMDDALVASRLGQNRGALVGARDMAERIEAAIAYANRAQSAAALLSLIGTSVATHEAVPAAFGLLALLDDPWDIAIAAANGGDDTDTIGAIACAMAGARGGMAALPAAKIAQLRAANDLPVERLARDLLALRPVTLEVGP